MLEGLIKEFRDYCSSAGEEVQQEKGTAERWEKLQAMRAHGFTMPWSCAQCSFSNASYPSVCEICGICCQPRV